MTARRLLLATLVAGCGVAQADTNTRRFTGSPLSGPYLTVEAAKSLGGGSYRFGLMGNFESRPAVFVEDEEHVEDIIASRLTLDAAFALGVTDHLDVGLVLPFTLKQSGRTLDDADELESYALGDPRIAARAILLGDEESQWSVASVLETWAPLSEGAHYAGYGGPGGSARVNLGYRPHSRTQVALNISYDLRPETNFAGVLIDDEVSVGLGVNLRVGPGEALAEGKLATDAFAPFGGPDATAGELNGAYRVALGDRHGLTIGAGLGLLPRLGTPLWRGFLGYSMVGAAGLPQGKRRVQDSDLDAGLVPLTMMNRPGDVDRDGIENTSDQCPHIAEDIDGFRDHDGCPESDNDLDYVIDTRDQAPISPEDWDGNGDSDGRPDLDNDQDGLADALDKCPSQAGAGDGCPGSPLDWQAELERQENEAPRTKPLTIGRLILPGNDIHFEPLEELPATRSMPLLRGLAEFIAEHPRLVRVEVGVHTKTGKGAAYDLWLSQLRAKALVEALSKLGVDTLRLMPRGYGSDSKTWSNVGNGVTTANSVELRALLPFEKVPGMGTLTKPEPSKGHAKGKNPEGVNIFQSNAPVKFSPRTARLREASQRALRELTEFLREHPKVSFEVAVHTNGLGDKQRMKRLSQQRAESVVQALVKQGIQADRLTAKGYGGSQLKASPKTREGRTANKRVELRWAKEARSTQ